MRRFRDSLQKSLITHDGVYIQYEVEYEKNDKPVLIFMHGLGGDLTCWDNERLFFKDYGYSTIAYDLRGHGLSSRPENIEQYEFEYFASDMRAIIEKENVKKCILIGHCFGGVIAMLTQYLYPKHIESLVLIDTNYKSSVLTDFSMAHSLIHKITLELAKHSPNIHINGYVDTSKQAYLKEYDIKDIAKDISHLSLKGFLLMLDNMMNIDLKNVLKKIDVPTLVMTGSNDGIFPPKIAEELHERIKDSEIDYIPGGNHIVICNNPVEVSISIHRFLKKNKFV